MFNLFTSLEIIKELLHFIDTIICYIDELIYYIDESSCHIDDLIYYTENNLDNSKELWDYMYELYKDDLIRNYDIYELYKDNQIDNLSYCDGPVLNQVFFSDPATITMEGILTFNKHLTILVLFIVCFVTWLLFSIFSYYLEFYNSYNSLFTHSKELEIIWTSVPAIVLLLLSSPSFTLLYSMDEVSDPELTIKILGHQWYWSYEISDFNSCQTETKDLKYVCYLMVLEGLPKSKYGYFRLLETNKRVILPTCSNLRLLVSSADVLHSWTIPAFGLKVDACPGRLNQLNLFLKRFGLFYGQCSEICGVNHGFMPIVILALPVSQYHKYLLTKLNVLNEFIAQLVRAYA